VSNGANLVPGNEVRSGGFRVGVVDDMKPVQLPGGTVGAQLSLKLDRSIGALPVDSRITIRPRSALGLKYVELEKGTAREVIPDGGLLPAKQATVPVELDEFYNTFDAPTREASQRNLQGFGDALAGRGSDLNRFIQAAPELTRRLEPVMANLADERTQLPRFFRELGDTARVLAPVSEVNARLFSAMADTFEAFSRDERALQETIRRGPRTLDAGTRSLTVQEPFLREFAALSTDLDAATGELRRALPTVNRALEVGTPVTRRSVRLYAPLQEAMVALRDLARAPTTNGALRGLTATVTTLQPQLRYLGPFITVCNSWNLFWTFTAEHFTAPDNTGSSQRALFNSSDGEAPDSVSSMGANEFVHGIKGPGAQGGGIPQHLHGNVWGNEALHSSGRANCQAGNAGYMHSGNRFAPPEYGGRYDRAVVDTPTEKEFPNEPPIGPNYRTFNKQGKGTGRTRERVPEGQTWTQQPGGKGINP
ncbi:MAG TPA: MlaD family protein, partial [Baekduia sp.]|nr:MlaD family protein [Baekduia sp.]